MMLYPVDVIFFMKLVQYKEYLVSAVDTDALVLISPRTLVATVLNVFPAVYIFKFGVRNNWGSDILCVVELSQDWFS